MKKKHLRSSDIDIIEKYQDFIFPSFGQLNTERISFHIQFYVKYQTVYFSTISRHFKSFNFFQWNFSLFQSHDLARFS